MPPKKHIHKYVRRMVNIETFTWQCGFPDCTHFLPKNLAWTINDKQTVCWNCGRYTVMDARNLKEWKPLCPDCHILQEEIEKSKKLSPEEEQEILARIARGEL